MTPRFIELHIVGKSLGKNGDPAVLIAVEHIAGIQASPSGESTTVYLANHGSFPVVEKYDAIKALLLGTTEMPEGDAPMDPLIIGTRWREVDEPVRRVTIRGVRKDAWDRTDTVHYRYDGSVGGEHVMWRDAFLDAFTPELTP